MANKENLQFFDRDLSESYDDRQKRIYPIIDNLHFLIGLILRDLPEDSDILCVGVGTGAEIVKLAHLYPGWKFTALDPSKDMLDVCQRNLDEQDLTSRCQFFHGYLEDFSSAKPFDAVLCLLVSHFLKDSEERQAMFDAMFGLLHRKGYLINAELGGDMSSAEFIDLGEKWKSLNLAAGSTQDQVDKMIPMLKEHASILPTASIEKFLSRSGFRLPVHFFQSFLVHAWYSQKE